MKTLYNDNDKFACGWLHNLVAAGHLPPGDVDGRDIHTLTGDDLKPYDQLHFFAGIGGWPLALRLAGWPADWPVWTGSCPCQPFSCAGKGRGNDDSRHLWPIWRRLIAECRPATIFGEQVASSLGREWLAGVRADLEALGYEVGAADLCAAGVGAPHIRQRLYWVAVATGTSWVRSERRSNEGFNTRGGSTTGGVADTEHAKRRPQCITGENVSDGCDTGRAETHGQSGACGEVRRMGDADTARSQGRLVGGDGTSERSIRATGLGFWSGYDLIPCGDGKSRRVEPGSFPLAHGVPGRVGLLRGYGNAIVPQVAAEFVKAFMEVTNA